MSTITTKDGTNIYYKDWATGPVVTLSHGCPLNADAWDGQMLFLVQNGYRCVALYRRGHGRSSQASVHNDMDGYADDLAAPRDYLRFTPQQQTRGSLCDISGCEQLRKTMRRIVELFDHLIGVRE